MYCKNCCLNSSVRLTELLVEMENLHWDVVLFSAAGTDTKQIGFEAGHRLYTHIGDHFAAVVFSFINVTFQILYGIYRFPTDY